MPSISRAPLQRIFSARILSSLMPTRETLRSHETKERLRSHEIWRHKYYILRLPRALLVEIIIIYLFICDNAWCGREKNQDFMYAVICIYYATVCACILYACQVDVK